MKIIICICALAALTMANESDLQKKFEDSNAQFTAKMFTEVAKINPDKSFVMSAFSVLTPLAELALASVGQSQDEIFKTTGFPNINVTKQVFSTVNRQYRNVKGIELKMANKIYVADGYKLNKQFAVEVKNVFNSEVQNVNFVQNVDTAKIINTWVEDQTNKRIKDLVDPESLDSDTRAILVNAIYFKGSWKDKFNKELTQNRPFHVNAKTTINIPTMYKQDDFTYGESEELGAKLIEIPYEGDEASFLIVLPNEVDGLNAVIEKLNKDPQALERAQQKMWKGVKCDLYVPKMKIETTTDLKEVLEEMDVKKIFTRDAGLTNLIENNSNLYVSKATQKAFIEVNEEGAEAAAANELGMSNNSRQFPRQIKVDRPFYFTLNVKSSPLFNGVFYESDI